MQFACFLVCHHSVGCGDDGDSETVENLRNIVALRVDTEARLGNTLDACDDRTLVSAVLQRNSHLLFDAFSADFVFCDVALFLEDTCKFCLDLGYRDDVNGVHLCLHTVADSGKHIGDRICHVHSSISSNPYQLAFLTPGIWPL